MYKYNILDSYITKWISDMSIGVARRLKDESKGQEFIDIIFDGMNKFESEVKNRGFDFKASDTSINLVLDRSKLNKLFDLIPMGLGYLEKEFGIGIISLNYNKLTNEWNFKAQIPRVFIIESFDNLKIACEELARESIFKNELTATPQSYTIEAGFTLLKLMYKYTSFWQSIKHLFDRKRPIHLIVEECVKLGYIKYKEEE